MKFYGHGVLLLSGDRIRFEKDPKKSVYECGTFETDNQEISKKLIAMGYEYDGELKKEAPAEKKAPAKEKPKEEVKDGDK